MIVGMMTLGTISVFGKTTVVKNHTTHTVVVNTQTPDRNCHCRNCEDLRKMQQKKTVNYCDCKNCKNKKNNGKKCTVTKMGQNCTCKSCSNKKHTHFRY